MHILIVDDDEAILRALPRAFKGVGYTPARGHRILTARDGTECERIVAQGPVDLIFMDGDLGRGDPGPIVVQKLRKGRCTARIVMMSSYDELSEIGIEAGADTKCDKMKLSSDTESVLSTLGILRP